MRSFDYLKIRDKKWDLEVLTLIAKIHEYKGKQELYIKQKPMSLEKLVEIAKVQSTEAVSYTHLTGNRGSIVTA